MTKIIFVSNNTCIILFVLLLSIIEHTQSIIKYMNQFESFSISLGNQQGQTSVVLLQQKRSKIQLVNLRAKQLDHPKIQIKKFTPLSLGILQECIRKKRDRSVLQDLLTIQVNCDLSKISQNCMNLQNKVENDLALLGALMQENKSEKFMQRTKASGKQAQKYLTKYGNLEEAVSQYLKHEQIVKKFMQQNQCTRENAINFLENNNYQIF